jgi:MFS family permease
MLTLVRALRHRPFALLWAGQTISVLGDKVFQVALAWWVLQKTGSAAAMGTVLVLTMAPMLVFLLFGGVLVDRLPRVRLMLISDVVRGAVISSAAMLAHSDRLALGHVYAFSLIFGTVDAIFQPAFRSVIPELTPPDDLPSANSLASLSGQLSGIAGPAIGGSVVLVGGAPLAFALDGLSFFVSGLCLVPLLGSVTPTEHQNVAAGIWGDLREGIQAVLASPWLWVTIGVAGLSNIAYSGPMDVTLPFLIKNRWHADVNVLGLFYSAGSLGSVVAAVWMGRRRRLRRRGLMLYGAWMLIGVLVMAIGLPIGIPGILAASLLIGACNSILGLVWVNTLQEFVPRNLLGRVTSVDYLGSYLFLPVGLMLGGWAAERFGPSAVFLIGGALHAALVALGLLHPTVRALD